MCNFLMKFMFKSLIRPFSTVARNAKEATIPRILNVAEKNDAAKSIAEILSEGQYRLRDGLSRYNKIYEFDYMLHGQQANMLVTSVSGHLLELNFFTPYRKWKSYDPLSLFDAPTEMICEPSYQNIKATLEKEIKNCNMLIIWTDCDREGENIGFEIIQVCSKVNPDIQTFRAKFSEITKQSITRACNSLSLPNKNISDAVSVRRELDLRIGAAFTRFQSMHLWRVFPNAGLNVISYGSCQFPTLGFVVERYKQIENFVPEPFWKLKVVHKVEKDEVVFLWKRNRLFDKTACQVLYDSCLKNPLATVVDVQCKPKTKWRPLPLDTIEFQKLASRKLHIPAKETLRIAEGLYSKGFISYPRTETNIFPESLDLVPLVEIQSQNPLWGEFARGILLERPNPRKGKKSDQAHPPIHPIKYAVNLQGREKLLYEFVVRHFLACVSKNAEGFETTVEVDIAQEKFTATGLMIVAKNYLDVYIYDTWNDKNIPMYNIGDKFDPAQIEMNESMTEPPPLLTEADLIALMDKHGIGTDATHAEHIEKIKTRAYAGVQNERFLPGKIGMGLVEGYDSMGFEMSKPFLRAELEADLKSICDGTQDPKAVLKKQIEKYRAVFVGTVAQVNKLNQTLAHYLEDHAEEVKIQEVQNNPLKPVLQGPSTIKDTDSVLRDLGINNSATRNDSCYQSTSSSPSLMVAQPALSGRNLQAPRHLQSGLPNQQMHQQRLPTNGAQSTNNVVVCNCQEDAILLTVRKDGPNQGRLFYVCAKRDNPCSFFLWAATEDDPSGNNISSSTSNARQQPKPNPWQTAKKPATANHSIGSSSDFTWQQFSPGPWQANKKPETTNHGWVQDDVTADIQCSCGVPAKRLTVHKNGPNQGRQFYRCAKRDNRCDFFLWAEAGDEPNDNYAGPSFRNTLQHSEHSRLQATPKPATTNHAQAQNEAIYTADIQCTCGFPAKRLTVLKDGPNKGRNFYICEKPQHSQCSFFMWDYGNSGNESAENYVTTSNQYPGVATSPAKPRCGICRQEGHNRKNCPWNK